ncbi:hypothetical protein QLS71_017415 [Mariniflexile litorale]|uniref:Uncharacterized protein n=1 Tax=Mariniflexile litorale TaxID=3045158 RepID=A0AAU7EF73_9FLAO|nr:hypothetical protein [Mariniflexile sp. KMM 9835]MDQ8211626.1 hypothetical protein [Mariniflexile sp. KMM 9835]
MTRWSSYITNLKITITREENTLTTDTNNVTYQWVDCNNSNAFIDSETNKNFNVTGIGAYTVQIQQLEIVY